jgi:hypothetical protein
MNLPSYAGKTTVYIDQNVLTMAVKEHDVGFFTSLFDRFQIIYSDETLREIKRSGEPDKFLAALDSLNAMHIRYQVNDSFEPTGETILHEISAVQAYGNYLQAEPLYEIMLTAAHQTTLKFHGGRSESILTDITSEQIDAFEFFVRKLSAANAQLGDTHPHLRVHIEQYLQNLQSQYEQVSAMAAAEMAKHIRDEIGHSGVNNYRASVGIGPVELNNINPPNVIKKIWEVYQTLDGYRDQGYTIDNFLGIAGAPLYRRAMHTHEKVTAIYNLLNIIGYKTDTKLRLAHRHIAAISDAAHAAIGSCAHIMLSADKVFVDKVRAIYEFLEVGTEVGSLSLVDGRILVKSE